jgi:hypothetical protein
MSESSPVEEHQSNTGEVNNAGSSVGQSKNSDSLVKTVKFNLSGDRCENYFKNNLRGDGQVKSKIFLLKIRMFIENIRSTKQKKEPKSCSTIK